MPGFRTGRPDLYAGKATLLSLLPGGPGAGDIGSGSLSGVTLVRSTPRTCLTSGSTLVTLAANQPCVEPAGLSIQAGHSNLLLQSEALENAAWTMNASGTSTPTVTANAATSPEGTLTADRLNLPAVGATQGAQAFQGFTVASTGVHTFSVWIRGVSGSGTCFIYLYNGTSIVASTTVNYTTTWTRFTVSASLPSGAGRSVNIGVNNQLAGHAVQPAQSIYVSGAQVETGAYAHSYVATTSSAGVTHNADRASMSSAAMPTATGTIDVTFTPLWSTAPAAGAQLFDTRGDVTPNTKGVSIGVDSSNRLLFLIGSVHLPAVQSSTLTWTPGQAYRIRGTWGGGNVALYRDGVQVASGSGFTMPTTHATLNLGDGRLGDGSFACDGNLASLRVTR